jgi:IS5 family transposase
MTKTESRPHNSTYPKGGVSCSKDSFVVKGSLVFQIKFCGKSPALRVAAKRWAKVSALLRLLPIGARIASADRQRSTLRYDLGPSTDLYNSTFLT